MCHYSQIIKFAENHIWQVTLLCFALYVFHI